MECYVSDVAIVGWASALIDEEIRAFETALRKAIEQSDLAEAEALIRSELARAPDALLQKMMDRPSHRLRIVHWDNIAADMEAARKLVPDVQLEREWRALLLGLINRNDVAGLPISVKFTFDEEPSRPDLGDRPSYMTVERFNLWQADVRNRIFLPRGPSYSPHPSAGRPHIEGLENLRSVHDRRTMGLPSEAERDAVFGAQSLAAAIVLLRFHQLVERYIADPGLPRPLAVFAHVETATRPMETNTIDYGTQATRLLQARTDAYHPAATAGVAARVRTDRAAARLRETREVVTAIRELEVALSLWSWWRNREERFRFKLVAGSYFDSARAAIGIAPGEGTNLRGERLCESYASVRLGKDAWQALELPSQERSPMHKLSIAYARKFGGPKVHKALAHVPPPPEALLRMGDYGL